MSTASSDSRRRSGKRAAVRRRLRSLRTQLYETRRRVRVATGAAALATAVAVGLAVQPGPAPEPVPLGKGTAGVVALADTTPAPAPPAAEAPPAPPSDGAEGTPIAGGEASYYGEELAGNPTASGEPFDPAEMTAAHRTLPLGTRVRVTHARTGESVVVRVNDRGPFHGDRVIDVSRAAADAIGLTRAGTAEVELERLPKTGGARG